MWQRLGVWLGLPRRRGGVCTAGLAAPSATGTLLSELTPGLSVRPALACALSKIAILRPAWGGPRPPPRERWVGASGWESARRPRLQVLPEAVYTGPGAHRQLVGDGAAKLLAVGGLARGCSHPICASDFLELWAGPFPRTRELRHRSPCSLYPWARVRRGVPL